MATAFTCAELLRCVLLYMAGLGPDFLHCGYREMRFPFIKPRDVLKEVSSKSVCITIILFDSFCEKKNLQLKILPWFSQDFLTYNIHFHVIYHRVKKLSWKPRHFGVCGPKCIIFTVFRRPEMNAWKSTKQCLRPKTWGLLSMGDLKIFPFLPGKDEWNVKHLGTAPGRVVRRQSNLGLHKATGLGS